MNWLKPDLSILSIIRKIVRFNGETSSPRHPLFINTHIVNTIVSKRKTNLFPVDVQFIQHCKIWLLHVFLESIKCWFNEMPSSDHMCVYQTNPKCPLLLWANSCFSHVCLEYGDTLHFWQTQKLPPWNRDRRWQRAAATLQGSPLSRWTRLSSLVSIFQTHLGPANNDNNAEQALDKSWKIAWKKKQMVKMWKHRIHETFEDVQFVLVIFSVFIVCNTLS